MSLIRPKLVEIQSPDAAPDDAALVAAARASETWAEEALYRRHGAHVHGVARRLLGSAADADDVLQDTFVVAFDRLAQLRDPAVFRSWLVRIAVHRVRRLMRRRAVLARLGLRADERFCFAPAPRASPEQRALLAELEQIVGALPAAERICWMLRHVEGYRLEEVAELAGCSLATAKRRLAAACARIGEVAGIEIDEPEAPR